MRELVSGITEERKVVTQEDYEDTLKAARERLDNMKQAEAIDINGNDDEVS